MQTKRTRYNVVGSGILHLLMHSAVAAVSVWGRGREPLAVSVWGRGEGTLGGVCVGKGEGTLGGVCVGERGDPWRCRVNTKSGNFSSGFIVPNLPYLKTVT